MTGIISLNNKLGTYMIFREYSWVLSAPGKAVSGERGWWREGADIGMKSPSSIKKNPIPLAKERKLWI